MAKKKKNNNIILSQLKEIECNHNIGRIQFRWTVTKNMYFPFLLCLFPLTCKPKSYMKNYF